MATINWLQGAKQPAYQRVLLTLAFAGGTAGALLGMWLFYHKTSKESFLERFWLVVAVQIVVAAGWYIFLRPH